MNELDDRFVPKVHPATREVEAEDPLELHATPMPGDPAVMLACLVQEYAWLGCNQEQIFALFRDPAYPALNALFDLYGARGLRDRIESLVRETGVLQFSGSVVEEPDPEDDDGDELVQLTVRTRSAD
jgi:hypothetical protein